MDRWRSSSPGALLARRISVPYWLAAAVLIVALLGSGVASYAVATRPADTPVAVTEPGTVGLELPPLGEAASGAAVGRLGVESGTLPAPDADLEARLEEATRSAARLPGLTEQFAGLRQELEQAQRDRDAQRDQARRESETLTATQAELAASEDRVRTDLDDLQARIGELEQQVRSTEQLVSDLRKLLGMPESAALAAGLGGPAVRDLAAAADPWQAARSAILTVEDRVGVLHDELAAVHAEAAAQVERLRGTGLPMTGVLIDDLAFWARAPVGAPVVGPLTSPFGSRISPFAGGQVREFHTGLDIGVPTGTPVKATGGGTVRLAGWYGGYGLLVIIDHGRGVSSWYGHNSRLQVSPGQVVRRGDVIALAGTTGRSTGPHVHYEIRINEMPIDPITLYRMS